MRHVFSLQAYAPRASGFYPTTVGSTTVDRLTPSDAGQGANRASAHPCKYDLNVSLKGQSVQNRVLTPEAFQRMLGISPDPLKLGGPMCILHGCAQRRNFEAYMKSGQGQPVTRNGCQNGGMSQSPRRSNLCSILPGWRNG
jgi:hypothetical protein